ncbi:hypothetical protein [Streptomyces sp. NPDC056480]|uniref:hypothetical protein n=1 Tax=Streptomyces sp. NPDC056480 TaxID=3345833 RepID=UPI00367580EB
MLRAAPVLPWQQTVVSWSIPIAILSNELTGIADPSADRNTQDNFPVSEVISAALPAFLSSKGCNRFGF